MTGRRGYTQFINFIVFGAVRIVLIISCSISKFGGKLIFLPHLVSSIIVRRLSKSANSKLASHHLLLLSSESQHNLLVQVSPGVIPRCVLSSVSEQQILGVQVQVSARGGVGN